MLTHTDGFSERQYNPIYDSTDEEHKYTDGFFFLRHYLAMYDSTDDFMPVFKSLMAKW